jgi:hypothetical protein
MKIKQTRRSMIMEVANMYSEKSSFQLACGDELAGVAGGRAAGGCIDVGPWRPIFIVFKPIVLNPIS